MNGRNGFTLPELMTTVAIGAIALLMAMRPAATYIQHTRVNRASAVVGGDLDMARSIAERQRTPVRLAFDSVAGQYTLTNRATGAVISKRAIGASSDYNVRTIHFTPAVTDFFPSGLTSGSLTVTLNAGGYSRQVTMSRVGLVRLP